MFPPLIFLLLTYPLWNTRGPNGREPHGFAFIQYGTKEEAELAKEKMHGRLVYGELLVVCLASEKFKYLLEIVDNSSKAGVEGHKMNLASGCLAQTSRSAKITTIKNKLKSDDEESSNAKKLKYGLEEIYDQSIDLSYTKGVLLN